MEAVKISQVAAVLKCPRCQSTQIEQPPQFVPGALAGHALTYKDGRAQKPPPLAANPDPHIRCVNCDSRWHESDVDTAGARYAELRKAYSAGAQNGSIS